MTGLAIVEPPVVLQPLAEFATGRRIVQFAVPWSKETLFLVPQAFHVRELREQGIQRGRIWLAAEVQDLLQREVTQADASSIAEAKLLLQGTVTSTNPSTDTNSEAAVLVPVDPVTKPPQRVLPFAARRGRRHDALYRR